MRRRSSSPAGRASTSGSGSRTRSSSILTAGIYSAWAKVRRSRYFLGNTIVLGDRLEYHATGMTILKGRLIAVAAIAVYFGIGFVSAVRPDDRRARAGAGLSVDHQSGDEVQRPHDFLAKRPLRLARDVLGRGEDLPALAHRRGADPGRAGPDGGPRQPRVPGQPPCAGPRAVRREDAIGAVLRGVAVDVAPGRGSAGGGRRAGGGPVLRIVSRVPMARLAPA